MEVIEENSQEDENLEDPRERRRVIDSATNRYEHPRELLRRANNNCEREEEDPRQGKMILNGREMVRDEYEREREIASARDKQRRREELEEIELQSGLCHIDNRVRVREHHRIDDIDQGRVTPQEREISRHQYDRTGNEERHDRVQIEANTKRHRRRREETEQQEIQEENQGRNNAEMGQKLVAMGSADQLEFNKEYRDKQLQNYGGADTVQPGSPAGQKTHYNKKAGRIVREQINLPKLNTTVDKPRNLPPPPPPPQGNTYAKEKKMSTFVIEVGAKAKNLYYITFCVVDVESPYNALIGRPWLH
ncbi:zinc finger CCCH domain-containing protein 13-like [Papaver somniferum]|uniref:zinc finger CCCH domain-containing protein 13-like n=1 Tax=Papaver somniferum TaxID=3469 RepID=UPI000E6FF3CB|nr:zinc finger CCCH domain-containing protein 13-like [Papaver somniferum]